MDTRGVVGQSEDTADRTLYGIDGPRRRPRTMELAAPPEPPPILASERTTVRERWRQEWTDRSRARDVDRGASPADLSDLDARFEALRISTATELGRRIDAALARMEGTFEREIEALRNANREEAKRFRSANGEAFVRIRAADTQELERIRRSVEEGIERLCNVLEGQLERVWGANDLELERIRSSGADRLAEVHDLLTHQLERLRAERSPDPPPPPRRRWALRPRSGSKG